MPPCVVCEPVIINATITSPSATPSCPTGDPVAGGGGTTAGTIIVGAVDGTPLFPDTGSLLFDQTDGFVITQTTVGPPGVVHINLIHPTPVITVKTVDGTPTYTDITTIQVEELDGFFLTNPSTNNVKLEILDASSTQAGIVSLTNQTMGNGEKYFFDPVGINTLTPDYDLDVEGDVGCMGLDVYSISPIGRGGLHLEGTTPNDFTGYAFNTVNTNYGSPTWTLKPSPDGIIPGKFQISSGHPAVEGAYAINLFGSNYTGVTGSFQTINKDVTVKGGIVTNIVTGGTGSGTSTISVGAADGSPMFSNTGTLVFDELNGFTITQTVAGPPGTVKIGLTTASSGVTSVGLSAPSIFTVTGSPVTTTGTLTFTSNAQSAKTVYAGPTTGSAAVPTFRLLASDDIPSTLDGKTFTGTSLFTGPTTFSSSVTFTGTTNLSGATIDGGVTALATTITSVTNPGTSSSEVSMVGTVIGSRTLSANYLTQGRTLRITAAGVYTTGGLIKQMQLKIKLGSTIVLAPLTPLPGMTGGTDVPWRLQAELTCRGTGSSGTVYGHGTSWWPQEPTQTQGLYMTSAVTIDTTTSLVVDLVSTTLSAGSGNTISCSNFILEALTPA